MRRHLMFLIFVGVLFSLGAPGLEATPRADGDTAARQAPVAVQRVALPSKGLRDEAAMVLVGTALIGLAAAVRRAA